MKESTTCGPILKKSYVLPFADVSSVHESNAPPPAPFSHLSLPGSSKRKQFTVTEDKEPKVDESNAPPPAPF
eukprot:10962938-Karenia_brevis.AAC.1